MNEELVYGSSHVEGLRIFFLDYRKMEFTSIASSLHNNWPAGEIVQSKCNRAPAHGHLKPEAKCMCGFWAYKSRRLLEHGDVCRGHVLPYRPQKQYESDMFLDVHIMGQPGHGKTLFTNSIILQMVNTLGPTGMGFPAHSDIRIKEYAQQPRVFSARIEQWGTVIEHTQGYRSEFARIIPHTIQAFPRHQTHRKHQKLVNFLREKYSV